MNITIQIGRMVDGEFMTYPEPGFTAYFGDYDSLNSKATFKFINLPRDLKETDLIATMINGKVNGTTPVGVKVEKSATLTVDMDFS